MVGRHVYASHHMSRTAPDVHVRGDVTVLMWRAFQAVTVSTRTDIFNVSSRTAKSMVCVCANSHTSCTP